MYPPFDESHFIEALVQLIKVAIDWVPEKRGHSLYIRHWHLATATFGVQSSKTFN